MPIEIHAARVTSVERWWTNDERSVGRRWGSEVWEHLTTETIKGTALSLESVDNIEGGDGLALGVLSIGDGITNDTLEEGLQDTTGLLVDHCDALAWDYSGNASMLLTSWNTLDTTTTSETSDSWLGDTLNVVTKNLAVTLGSTLSKTLSSLSACCNALARGAWWWRKLKHKVEVVLLRRVWL